MSITDPSHAVPATGTTPTGNVAPKRILSEIVFPYGDLEDAVGIARALHSKLGYNCEPDQLAAYMGTEAKNGTFRVQVATARIFGAVEVGRGSVALTDLGARLADEEMEREARVEAFLNVPLYGRLYETFRGRKLPGNRGLENEMKTLGVSPRQLVKARVAFQRSAEQAGFFAHGTSSLVRPADLMPQSPAASQPPEPVKEPPKHSEADAVGLGGLHPLLVGLIKTIPREGEAFPPRRQQQWLEAAKVNFALIFGADDDEDTSSAIAEARRDFSG